MLIEAARRAEAAAKEMLACINAGAAPCAEMREALEISKAFMAAGSAFQVGAAQVIARAERHGDGGAQVLADTAGVTRHDARGQVKTAQTIEAVPAVRDAVESGRVPMTNARRLADAIEKTSAEAVESDAELLARAESMRPEQFIREARRWTANHQADGGASDYKRLRAKRCVRIWDGEDGTVELHGKFDPVAGRRIGNRLEAEARRLYDTDKTTASESERRSFDQCMADALDNLTSHAGAGNGKAFADICVVAHVDDATGELIAELPDGVRLPQAVLEQLSCNAKVCGVVYDRTGKPIWRTEARRTVTKSQWQLLIARYGGCFHCGANPAICQGHHIEPVSQGGPTKLDNLVPACWICHHRIHHDGWQIHKRPNGQHTLHPPNRTHYGPALTPEHPPLFISGDHHTPATPTAQSCPEPATSDTTHDANPRLRPGPASARAALRSARNERDGPEGGITNGTDPSHPRPGSDPPPKPKDESLFIAG